MVVEAFQWTEKPEDEHDRESWPAWLRAANKLLWGVPGAFLLDYQEGPFTYTIMTLDGKHVVSGGDYIIQGINGEHLPMQAGHLRCDSRGCDRWLK